MNGFLEYQKPRAPFRLGDFERDLWDLEWDFFSLLEVIWTQ